MRILSVVFILSFLAGKLKTFEQMLPWKNSSEKIVNVAVY